MKFSSLSQSARDFVTSQVRKSIKIRQHRLFICLFYLWKNVAQTEAILGFMQSSETRENQGFACFSLFSRHFRESLPDECGTIAEISYLGL